MGHLKKHVIIFKTEKELRIVNFKSQSSLLRMISPKTSPKTSNRESMNGYQRFSSIEWEKINACKTDKLARTEFRKLSKVYI